MLEDGASSCGCTPHELEVLPRDIGQARSGGRVCGRDEEQYDRGFREWVEAGGGGVPASCRSRVVMCSEEWLRLLNRRDRTF